MKIRMKTHITGTRNGAYWPPAGTEIELPQGEATDLCTAGLAEPVAEPPQPQKAAAKKPETRKGR